MPIEYVNRKGDRYFLQEGRTRTGKPRYYFGRQMTGTPVDAVPEGFEIHESPETAQVHLRKAVPTAILPAEKELLVASIPEKAGLSQFLVQVEKDALVVYLPAANPDALAGMLARITGMTAPASLLAEMADRSGYCKELRFQLADPVRRRFTAARWSERGEGHWFWMCGPDPLPELIDRCVPHLGKESMYELYYVRIVRPGCIGVTAGGGRTERR